MIIRAGYSISYDCPKPMPTPLGPFLPALRLADARGSHILAFLKTRDHTDNFGNICTRLTADDFDP